MATWLRGQMDPKQDIPKQMGPSFPKHNFPMFFHCSRQTLVLGECWALFVGSPRKTLNSNSPSPTWRPCINHYFSLANSVEEVKTNCTRIWKLSPLNCNQVPQGKHGLDSYFLGGIFFLWTIGSKVRPIACHNTILFHGWLLSSFLLSKSSK